jgi:hypothetical protein
VKQLNRRAWPAILLAVGILTAPAAFGNSVKFDFGPAGAPSVNALFEDSGPNQVQLTISALGLSGNNSLNSLCFNLNPAFDAHNLIFTQTGSTGGVQGLVNTANDSYKVGGGSGKFDIDVVFGPSHAFIAGDTVTYSITGIGGLSVNDFLFLETPTAGRTQTYAAGSLQELSGFEVIQGSPQAVPDTSYTLGLLAISFFAVGLWARRVRAEAAS